MLSRAAVYAITPQGARLAFEIAARISAPGGAHSGCGDAGTLTRDALDQRLQGPEQIKPARGTGGRVFLSAGLRGRPSGQVGDAEGSRTKGFTRSTDVWCAAGEISEPPVRAGVGSSQASPAQSAVEPVFFERIQQQLAENFHEYPCHIMICASGIALRSLAPLLRAKDSDPAVLLLDQRGEFVISLLSGHLGGANRAARELAALLGATPVITTATDCENLPALDELAARKNLRIVNLGAVRKINSALLRVERPLLLDSENLLGLRGTRAEGFFELIPAAPASPCLSGHVDKMHIFDEFFTKNDKNCATPENPGKTAVLVDPPAGIAEFADSGQILILLSKKVWLGLGCKRGIEPRGLENFAQALLLEHGLGWEDLAGLASIDLKRDEEALLKLAERYRLPLLFFTAEELNAVPAPTPSERVRQATGTAGVCEAAAMLAAGYRPEAAHGGWTGRLISPKRKGEGMTAALARTD